MSKIIIQSIPPIWTAAIRATIATCTLFTIQLATKQCIIPKKHDIPILLVIGIFHLTFFTIFMSLGLQRIPAGKSIVLGYTTPLWVVPAAMLFLRESINKIKILGVLLGIAGVIILIDPLTFATQNSSQILGNGFLILSSIFWAASIIYTKHYTWHSTAFQLISWQMLLASFLLSGMAFYFEGIPHIEFTNTLITQLVYTGCFAAAFGFWAMTEITRRLPAVEVSLASLLTPVVGISSSQIFLGEALDFQLVMGAILIFCGMLLACVISNPSQVKNIK